MPQLSQRVNQFTDSVIRRMTRISDEYGAINLSQGFPDFDPPKELLDALAGVAYHGPHQYSVTFGAENLRQALAKKHSGAIGRAVDPESEVLVTCGPGAEEPDWDNRKLEELWLPEHLERVGDYGFFNCAGLRQLHLQNLYLCDC